MLQHFVCSSEESNDHTGMSRTYMADAEDVLAKQPCRTVAISCLGDKP